mmetsp:Transcript_19456/g.54672  ORF Transcript_19456/g.54672 Transcript_19456/m.54672 type:complete len:274 (-) Transcript_19456:2375-3196(-)
MGSRPSAVRRNVPEGLRLRSPLHRRSRVLGAGVRCFPAALALFLLALLHFQPLRLPDFSYNLFRVRGQQRAFLHPLTPPGALARPAALLLSCSLRCFLCLRCLLPFPHTLTTHLQLLRHSARPSLNRVHPRVCSAQQLGVLHRLPSAAEGFKRLHQAARSRHELGQRGEFTGVHPREQGEEVRGLTDAALVAHAALFNVQGLGQRSPLPVAQGLQHMCSQDHAHLPHGFLILFLAAWGLLSRLCCVLLARSQRQLLLPSLHGRRGSQHRRERG